ncbi:MAG: hypothetical protein ABIV05_08940, partial [Actinomycetota bacterium]
RVFVDVPHERLDDEVVRVMTDERLALAQGWRACEVPGWSMTELTVGDATLAWDVDAQLAALRALVDTARG